MCAHNGLNSPCGQCWSYTPPYIRSCDPGCNSLGCPIQLDAGCVIYHQSNNTLSNLINLNLPNGSTVSLILDAIDQQLGQLQVQNFNLPCLRGTFSYVINTMQQFAQDVDTTLCVLNTNVNLALANSSLPLSVIQSDSVTLTPSGTLNHTLRADVNISATANNLLSILPDGLFAEPQTLDVDYATNQLIISEGNTVTLPNAPSGFLGNLASDPGSPADGNYWYNTTSTQLKIRVNGATKIITTT